MLAVEGVGKRFGGLQALSNVNLSLPAGQITGIIGPNGAGKSTLVNVISGFYPPDVGRVMLGDRDVTRLSFSARARLGVIRTFQHPHLFSGMSTLDMVTTSMLASRTRPQRSPDEVLRRFDLSGIGPLAVDTLPYGVKKLLNVAVAWALAPKALLLDEPFAGVGGDSADAFGSSIAKMADDGLAIGLIEHNVAVVMRLSTSLVVLDSGSVIFAGSPQEGQRDVGVIAAYLGHSLLPEEVGP